MDGRRVSDTDELRNRIAQTLPGAEVRLEILRDGRERTVRVKLGGLEAGRVASGDVSRRQEKLGWEVQELTEDLAGRLGYDEGSGVVVTDVRPGSVAQRAGLRQGDLIMEINRQPVRSLAEYAEVIGSVKAGETMLLLARAKRLLEEKRNLLEKVGRALLEREVLTRQEFEELAGPREAGAAVTAMRGGL